MSLAEQPWMPLNYLAMPDEKALCGKAVEELRRHARERAEAAAAAISEAGYSATESR